MSKMAEAARLEQVRREQARRTMEGFGRYVLREERVTEWAAHHSLICFYLDQVVKFIVSGGQEGIGRLMILAPPRYWKSLLAARLLVAFLLGKLPDAQVIISSYASDLANEHSRNAKDFVESEKFAAVFGAKSTMEAPVELDYDRRSVKAWGLGGEHRGSVRAAGVGSGITGMGAHLLVLDDTLKDREEAEREAQRELVWNWYTSTAYTRLEKGGAVVVPMTRWHVDDLAGRLLKRMASDPLADQWVVVALPMVAYGPEELARDAEEQRKGLLEGIYRPTEDPMGRLPGEMLWEAKHDKGAAEKMKANLGPYDWSSLDQQQPYLKAGTMFNRNWFDVVEGVPDGVTILEWVRYWDKATTAGAGARTAGVKIGRGSNRHFYVGHVVKGQWSQYQRDLKMVETAKADAEAGDSVTIWHEQEPGSSGKDAAQATNAMFAEFGFTAHFGTATGAKEERAQPWSSMCEAGRVHLIRGGWNEEYIEEHVAFPRGSFKDQVDASSGGFGKLLQMVLDGPLMA